MGAIELAEYSVVILSSQLKIDMLRILKKACLFLINYG